MKKENNELLETLNSYDSFYPPIINKNVRGSLSDDDMEDVGSLNACAQTSSNFHAVHKAQENLFEMKDKTGVYFDENFFKNNAKAAATHDSYKSTTKPHVSQPICVDQALSSTACSISSQEIANFSPEYFHGYKLHTACNNCTRKEHFKVPEPSPFSAFLYCEMPSSLVTHWLSPHQLSISASNSSCASLRSHCVKWPSPGELLYTADDILRELMDRMKKSKWWTEH